MNRPASMAQEEAVFKRVIGEPTARRSALLDDLCAGDALLRSAVERLLELSDEPEGVLDKPVMGGGKGTAPDGDDELAPGASLSGYTITGRLGRGGMGVVYTARQQRPHRDVALKVIRADIANRAMLRRFEQEADILARLQHPGIAQVFEAGVAATPAGDRAFIAMELIDGRLLDKVCSDPQVSLTTKLRLLIEICEAVDHAHQRGVIHRDLKPANILVIAATSTPVPGSLTAAVTLTPKVLDFGVARAVEQEPGATLVTQAGQIVGTPAYMSPEQFSGNSSEIGTRSDIYTLGVVAFEMLSGRLPHEPGGKSIMEMASAVREQSPPLLGSLDRSLRGDIETIVARALSIEQQRRYQTAGDFAADVRRHLASEPIDAKRDSTLYVLSRRVKRNPRISMLLAALGVIIAVGLSFLAVSERRQNTLRAQNAQAVDRVKSSEAQNQAAQGEISQLSSILKDTLRNVRALAVPGKDFTMIRELMEQTRKQVDHAGITQPTVEAELRTLMGDIYYCLRMPDEATEQHERGVALLTRDIDRASPAYTHALCRLASDRRQQGNIPEARSLLDRALAAMELQSHPDPTHLAEVHLKAGEAYWMMGEYAKAEQLARGTADAFEKDPAAIPLRVTGYATYGMMLVSLGRQREAIDYFVKGVAVLRTVGHEVRSVLADTLNRLAVAQIETGDPAAAEPSLLEAIEIDRGLRGEDAPAVALFRVNLACVYQITSREHDAAALLNTALPNLRETDDGELTFAAADMLEARIPTMSDSGVAKNVSTIEESITTIRARARRNAPH